jgi:hypothetical protein
MNPGACTRAALILAAALSLAVTACGTMEGNIVLGTVGATAIGAKSTSSEIEQTYYVGVFDPQDQVPPQVYRLRVHGQASFISFAKFASGWVRADIADSLGSRMEFDKQTNQLTMSSTADDVLNRIQTGRRLVMFGPEGFREAPADHRLVVVMGSNPEGYFEAIDGALGDVSQAKLDQHNSALTRQLFEALVLMRTERDRLTDLDRDVERDLPGDKP